MIISFHDKHVGISYISNKKHDVSSLYDEEISVDKYTGEVLVKAPTTKNLVSYNYYTRKTNHIDKLYMNALTNGIRNGVIVEIIPDDITLPATTVDFVDKNIIGTSPLEITHKVNDTILSIDMDVLDVVEDNISKDFFHDALVSFKMYTVKDSSPVRIYEDTVNFDTLSNMVFAFPEDNDGLIIDKIIIKIKPTDPGVVYRYVLNSIMLFTYTKNRVVTGISVLSLPTKRNYMVGDTFDPTGMVVALTYNNGDTEIITDYTIDSFDTTRASTGDAVYVSYGGIRTSFTVNVTNEPYVYEVVNDEVILISYVGHDDVVSVPDTINGLPVTEIREDCFTGTSVTSVTIPDTVTVIH